MTLWLVVSHLHDTVGLNYSWSESTAPEIWSSAEPIWYRLVLLVSLSPFLLILCVFYIRVIPAPMSLHVLKGVEEEYVSVRYTYTYISLMNEMTYWNILFLYFTLLYPLLGKKGREEMLRFALLQVFLETCKRVGRNLL